MLELITKYILDENWIRQLFFVLAIVSPLFGFIIGTIMDKYKKSKPKFMVLGTAFGFLGTLNLLLWKIYNWITEYFGLTTVKNLLFNLVFFLVIGVILGFLFFLLTKFTGAKNVD
jgi:hypothetical protein